MRVPAILLLFAILFWGGVKAQPVAHIHSPHTSYTRQIEFSPDGSKFLTASENEVIIWDLQTGKQIKVFNGYEGGRFSSDGRCVILLVLENIHVRKILSGELVYTDHSVSVKYYPKDSAYYDFGFTYGYGKRVDSIIEFKKFNEGNGEMITHFKLRTALEGHQHSHYTLSPRATSFGCLVANTGYRILGTDFIRYLETNSLLLYTGRDFEKRVEIRFNTEVKNFVFSPDESKVATSDGYIYDPLTGRTLVMLELKDPQNISELAFSEDSKFIVGWLSREIVIWDAKTGQKQHSFPYDDYSYQGAKLIVNGNLLHALTYPGIHTFDIKTGVKIYSDTLLVNYPPFSLSSDGKRLLLVDSNILILDAETGYISNRIENKTLLPPALDIQFYGSHALMHFNKSRAYLINLNKVQGKQISIQSSEKIQGKIVRNYNGVFEVRRFLKKRFIQLRGRHHIVENKSYWLLGDLHKRVYTVIQKRNGRSFTLTSCRRAWLSPDNRTGVFYIDSSYKFFDLDKKVKTFEIAGLNADYSRLQYNPSGTYLFLDGANGVEVWNIIDHKLIFSTYQHFHNNLQDAIFLNDSQIAFLHWGRLTIMSVHSNTAEHLTIRQEYYGFHLTEDGTRLVLSPEFSDSMYVFNLEHLKSKLFGIPPFYLPLTTLDSVFVISEEPYNNSVLYSLDTSDYGIKSQMVMTGYETFKKKDIIVSSYDGWLYFYDLRTFKLILTYRLFNDGNWFITTPSGHFDASRDLIDSVFFFDESQYIDSKEFRMKYYQPGLWKKTLGDRL